MTTQNVTNPALGPFMLEKLAGGESAAQAVSAARQHDAFPDYRQLLAVDVQPRRNALGYLVPNSGLSAGRTLKSASRLRPFPPGTKARLDGSHRECERF
ncbi:DUF1028 domain-containing protein [Rhizobium sp. LjRoot258]|uniref:DUF1028 domain-containing protein n=1 Tax=Rhizobium sp. LjRoot258 TaxID=3342299 RepID=UPI003ECDE81D